MAGVHNALTRISVWFTFLEVFICISFPQTLASSPPSVSNWVGIERLRESSRITASKGSILNNQLENNNRRGLAKTKNVVRSLSKRAIITYEDCYQNGKCLMDQLNGEDVQTQSDYNSWSQVKGTGWKDYTGSVPSINFETEFPGAGFSQRDFKLYSCQYPQPWMPDDRSFVAGYQIYVNTKAGVIIVTSARSPRKPYLPPDALENTPMPMKRLSDFTFLAYQDASGDDTGCWDRLQWVIHYSILNSVTHNAIEKATGKEDNYPIWPGLQYQTNTQEGQAMIGCPNGFGIAFMLQQRSQGPMGRKTVDYVNVLGNPFHGDETLNTNLAFHLKDYTPPPA